MIDEKTPQKRCIDNWLNNCNKLTENNRKKSTKKSNNEINDQYHQINQERKEDCNQIIVDDLCMVTH